MDAIFEKVLLKQSRNIQDAQNKLNQLKEMVSTNDFGMIIDGLNIAHEGRRGPNRRLVSMIINCELQSSIMRYRVI